MRHCAGRDSTVCLSIGRFWAAVGLPLVGGGLRTPIGTGGGVDEDLLTPVPSRLQSFGRTQRARRQQGSLYQSSIPHRRERREVCRGFRPSHLALGPQDLTGRRGLGIREDEEELLGHRGPLAFGAPSRFAPARSGLPSSCSGWLLGWLVEVP